MAKKQTFPVLRHTEPCDECPWRRNHPAGWLGGYAPEDFTVQVQFDGPPVPCHKTIPPGDDMTAAVSMCAGALIFMKNSCKLSRHPAYGDALDSVNENTETVFQWPHEFLEYHRDPEGWIKQAKKRAASGR